MKLFPYILRGVHHGTLANGIRDTGGIIEHLRTGNLKGLLGLCHDPGARGVALHAAGYHHVIKAGLDGHGGKGHGVGAGAALPVHLDGRDFHGEAGSQRRGASNILPVVIQDISKDDVVNQRGVNTGAANSLPDSKGAQVRRSDRGQSPSYPAHRRAYHGYNHSFSHAE